MVDKVAAVGKAKTVYVAKDAGATKAGGVLDAGEACDDGNACAHDGCRNDPLGSGVCVTEQSVVLTDLQLADATTGFDLDQVPFTGTGTPGRAGDGECVLDRRLGDGYCAGVTFTARQVRVRTQVTKTAYCP